MAGGRPTKYKKEFAQQAYKLCLLGHTDAELAVFFDVQEATINNWKRDHTQFLESIKKGKDLPDGEVAASLFHRATGYSHEDVDIKVINNKIVKTKLQKQYPPDPTAAIFWLKNRQPKKWRDKQEVENTNLNINTVPVSKEEARQIAKDLEDEY